MVIGKIVVHEWINKLRIACFRGKRLWIKIKRKMITCLNKEKINSVKYLYDSKEQLQQEIKMILWSGVTWVTDNCIPSANTTHRLFKIA